MIRAHYVYLLYRMESVFQRTVLNIVDSQSTPNNVQIVEYPTSVFAVAFNTRVGFTKLLYLPATYHCSMSFTTPAMTQLTSSPKRGSVAPSAM